MKSNKLTAFWSVNETGYTVQIVLGGKVIETYEAGNHPGDSQAFLPADDPLALSQDKLREYAETSAREIAGEYGIEDRVFEEEQ